MINLALCDDDETFLKELADKIKFYFNDKKLDISLQTFTNGTELFILNEPFDFIFLDIDMPEINGIEIAKVIKKHEKTNIIFVTNHDSLVYESVKYQPLRFIRKSKIEQELNEALEKVIQLHMSDIKTILLNTKNGKIEERLNDILYIEVYNHDVIVHTINKELHVYGTLSEYENILKVDGFIKTYKNCLVNCHFIYSINTNNVTLDNQLKLPLSRHKAKNVQNFFHDYIRRN